MRVAVSGGRPWEAMADEQRPQAEIFLPSWRVGAGPLSRLVVQPAARFKRIEAAGGIVTKLSPGVPADRLCA